MLGVAEAEKHTQDALALLIGLGPLLVGGAVLFLFWRWLGYDNLTAQQPLAFPPDNLSPGLVGALVNLQALPSACEAALADLAQRGWLVFRGVEAGPRSVRALNLVCMVGHDTLAPFEQEILRALFGETLAYGRSITLGEARKRLHAHAVPISRKFNEALYALGMIRRTQAQRVCNVLAVVLFTLALLALGFVLARYYQESVWFLSVPFSWALLGALAALIGMAWSRRTSRGVKHARAWRRFELYLRRIGHGEEPIPPGLSFGPWLGYAFALRKEAQWAALWAVRFGRSRFEPPAWFSAHDLPPERSAEIVVQSVAALCRETS